MISVKKHPARLFLICCLVLSGFILAHKMFDSDIIVLSDAKRRVLSFGTSADKTVYSNGFFAKLNTPATEEEDWGKVKCPLTELTNLEDFYKYINYMPATCKKSIRLGGKGKVFANGYIDGAKWLCMDATFNMVIGNCLIYSFGIDHDTTFDNIMDKSYNCKIHGFDPTLGWKDHNITDNFRFYNLGISNVTDLSNPKLKVDRYINILKRVGHLDIPIDYLKIDVEGYEMHFMNDLFANYPNLLKNVKQLSMEIHAFKPVLNDFKKELWTYFQKLECFGFQIFKSELNVYGKMWVNGVARSCCYEIVWIRTRQW